MRGLRLLFKTPYAKYWKSKNWKPYRNAIIVTGDVVGLHPSITDECRLRAIKEALDEREIKAVPKEDWL